MQSLRHLKLKLIPQLFIIYTRYLIGGAFVFASIVKIKGERFTAVDGSDSPLNSPFHLLETLYRSGLYWEFLGYSYGFTGTPFITGSMLIANIMLVLWDWDEIKILLNITPVMENKNTWMHDKVWEITGLVLFLFDTTYRFFTDGYTFFIWLVICFLIGLIGLIFGLKKRKVYENSVLC